MFARGCVAVLALCLLHHLIMATLGHALVMGAAHDGGVRAPHARPAAMVGAGAAGPVAGHGMPPVPLPLLGDCPAQQAVFPLLMVLTLLLGLALLLGERGGGGFAICRARPARLVSAPLMPPRQRRALLQVFTI